MWLKDLLPLLRISILKGGWVSLSAIIWFIYLPIILPFLGDTLSENSFSLQKLLAILINDKESWLIQFDILVLVILVISFILFKEIIERYLNYLKRGSSYSLTIQSWYKDWIYNGKSKITSSPPRLIINSSRAGCLLNRYLWKNFEMKFDMNFLERGILGIVFRAEDLENYFMLQLRKERDSIVVVPHVRYSGMWEIMSQDVIGPNNGSNWLKVHLKITGRKAVLNLENIGNYVWDFPTHVDVNHIEAGDRKNQNNKSISEEVLAAKVTYLPEIPFRDSYGRIGFRAHLDEGAEIQSLTIKNLGS